MNTNALVANRHRRHRRNSPKGHNDDCKNHRHHHRRRGRSWSWSFLFFFFLCFVGFFFVGSSFLGNHYSVLGLFKSGSPALEITDTSYIFLFGAGTALPFMSYTGRVALVSPAFPWPRVQRADISAQTRSKPLQGPTRVPRQDGKAGWNYTFVLLDCWTRCAGSDQTQM